MRPFTWMVAALRKGCRPRQVDMTKPCLSFPRLFISLFMVLERVWTLSSGLGLLISGGYRLSYQTSEDLGFRAQPAQLLWYQIPWLLPMGMSRFCLYPVALDPMVGASYRSVDPAPYTSFQLCPLPDPVPNSLSKPTSSGFGESVRACPCLTLPHSQMPDLGVDLRALPLRDGQSFALGLRPFEVSRESGHRRRRLDGAHTMLGLLAASVHPPCWCHGAEAWPPFYS